ncbi:MAG: bifunctional 5,10-methylenetetrahydrofolate dehydrogenase/5,10-methenyltetrahydrofolate cyclohydrolase [Candidatus Heimdallarchaeaceae archaeon]|jgi:methylenetetrahydrofolate dehydrogenase (NADP+)/methenyltetrahydrofolate cyclohydrolase
MNQNEEKSKILDGRFFAQEYLEKILKPRCKVFTEEYKKLPKLSTIVVGDDPASESYLRIKDKFFEKLCVKSEVFRLPEDITEQELLDFIDKQNKDDSIDGILVQIPLPSHIDEDRIIESVDPSKDVEGLSPGNVYAWTKSLPILVPATALGVLALLKFYKIPLKGKHVVVVGRSMIVGKPAAHLLLKEHATVTICHSRTKPLEKYTRDADILVAAVGRPHIIKKGMIKEGAVVVDVGVNFEDGKLIGDADYEDLIADASYISPVPGGSGPATVCMLASNLLLAFELKKTKDDKEKINCLKTYYGNYSTLEETDFCI